MPTRDRIPSGDNASFEELIAEVRLLREQVVELSDALAASGERVAELEKLLKDSRHSSKRQPAPFSKGELSEEPKRPGRKTAGTTGATGIAWRRGTSRS